MGVAVSSSRDYVTDIITTTSYRIVEQKQQLQGQGLGFQGEGLTSVL